MTRVELQEATGSLSEYIRKASRYRATISSTRLRQEARPLLGLSALARAAFE